MFYSGSKFIKSLFKRLQVNFNGRKKRKEKKRKEKNISSRLLLFRTNPISKFADCAYSARVI